jgi:hypothetical protein
LNSALGVMLPREVGERPDRDDADLAGRLGSEPEQGVDGVLRGFGGVARRHRQPAGAVTVDVLGRLPRPQQRPPAAEVDGHRAQLPGDIEGEVGVGDLLVEADVARHHGDRAQVRVGVQQREQDRDAVVLGGVGVDDQRDAHGPPMSGPTR